MPEPWNTLVQFIAAGGAGAGLWDLVKTLLTKPKQRADTRKVEVDTVQVISSAATNLVEPLNKIIDELEEKLAGANARADDLQQKLKATNARADGLERQLVSAQVETQQLRTQVDRMSKDLLDANEELARMKGEPWPRTP